MRECISDDRDFDGTSPTVMHVRPVSTVRVQQLLAPAFNTARFTRVEAQVLARRRLSEGVGVDEHRCVQRDFIIHSCHMLAQRHFITLHAGARRDRDGFTVGQF